MSGRVHAFAPGRVNLIGDHTDHTGGWVLPMAIDRGTTVAGRRGGEGISLRSTLEVEPADLPLVVRDPMSIVPAWARYVAGVVAELAPTEGFFGSVATTLPVGGGLSSSAALEVAVALALGAADDDPVALAHLCRRAEQRASGVPCGIMDQLASAAGVDDHALLIDCTTEQIEPIAIPPGLEVAVVHSGQPRALSGSAYSDRRDECVAADEALGSLRTATLDDVSRLADPVLRRRARHVVSENARVLAFAEALRRGDAAGAGALMVESHASLRDDLEVSTAALDALVSQLVATPGVHGARLTGAGFGGCAVALVDAGAAVEVPRVRASEGARVQVLEHGA